MLHVPDPFAEGAGRLMSTGQCAVCADARSRGYARAVAEIHAASERERRAREAPAVVDEAAEARRPA